MFCDRCARTFGLSCTQSPRVSKLCRDCDSVSIDEWELLIEKIHLQTKEIERLYEIRAPKAGV